MADSGDSNLHSFRGMGRARVLVEVTEYFCRRERGQRPPSLPPGQRGRAGAQALIRRLVENHPGTNPGSAMRGRGKGRGLRYPFLPHPGGRGRARALYLPPQCPLPAPGPARPNLLINKCSTGPCDAPTLYPMVCLESQGRFSNPPSMIPMAPQL